MKETKICDRCGRATDDYHKEIIENTLTLYPMSYKTETWIICKECDKEDRKIIKKL